jgi:hypothetical protein
MKRFKISSVTWHKAKRAWQAIRDRGERGSSLAWVAIFLAAIVVPLLALVIDGSRLFYVRGRQIASSFHGLSRKKSAAVFGSGAPTSSRYRLLNVFRPLLTSGASNSRVKCRICGW